MPPYDWSVIAQRFSVEKKSIEKTDEVTSTEESKSKPHNWNWLTLALWNKQQKEVV